MIQKCEVCGKSVDVPRKIKYCKDCKHIGRKKAIERFKPKSRIKSKEYRKNNREECRKKQRQCYYNKKDYYLKKAKEYRKNNLEKIKQREIEIRNQAPHRKLLLDLGIVPICKGCGAYENHSGYQLSVHHIDGNHKNNVFKNLVWACESCHQRWHNPNGINSEMEEVKHYEKESR